jgi:hypothetical protein
MKLGSLWPWRGTISHLPRCQTPLMSYFSINGTVNDQPAGIAFDGVGQVLTVRSTQGGSVLLRLRLTANDSAVYVSGSELVIPVPSSSRAPLGGTGQRSEIIPEGTDAVRFRSEDVDRLRRFVDWVNSVSGAGNLVGTEDGAQKLRQQAQEVGKYASWMESAGQIFGILSVLVGVIVALIPTENCERFSCTNSYDSIGVGLGLAVSGGLTAFIVFTLSKFIGVKALETHVRSVSYPA